MEYAARPKGSQESQRLLSEKQVIYGDGGTQFIPVDFDAYKELTDKGIPTVHPQKLQTQEIGGTGTRTTHTYTRLDCRRVSREVDTDLAERCNTDRTPGHLSKFHRKRQECTYQQDFQSQETLQNPY